MHHVSKYFSSHNLRNYHALIGKPNFKGWVSVFNRPEFTQSNDYPKNRKVMGFLRIRLNGIKTGTTELFFPTFSVIHQTLLSYLHAHELALIGSGRSRID